MEVYTIMNFENTNLIFVVGCLTVKNQWVLLKGDYYFYSPFTHLDMMFPSLFVKAPFQGKPTLYSPAYLSPLDQVNVP